MTTKLSFEQMQDLYESGMLSGKGKDVFIDMLFTLSNGSE